MARRPLETIERLEKAKIGLRLGQGTTRGRADNVIFVARESALYKGLGDVGLLRGAVLGSSDSKEGAKLKLGQDRSKTVALGPVVGIKIAEDDNPIFAADRIAIFILL